MSGRDRVRLAGTVCQLRERLALLPSLPALRPDLRLCLIITLKSNNIKKLKLFTLFPLLNCSCDTLHCSPLCQGPPMRVAGRLLASLSSSVTDQSPPPPGELPHPSFPCDMGMLRCLLAVCWFSAHLWPSTLGLCSARLLNPPFISELLFALPSAAEATPGDGTLASSQWGLCEQNTFPCCTENFPEWKLEVGANLNGAMLQWKLQTKEKERVSECTQMPLEKQKLEAPAPCCKGHTEAIWPGRYGLYFWAVLWKPLRNRERSCCPLAFQKFSIVIWHFLCNCIS